ncbi:MAG: DUF1858 domain-containing protein [candidate division Zixibacteria bacterium]|nr:DUF1858 domain-containing protein [candidate division Zixibacteria bacterium]
MAKIQYSDHIEDIIWKFPDLNGFLMSKGMNCIVCGEPAWGTIGEFITSRGLDAEMIIAEYNAKHDAE